jgi:S-adenosylmethionine/arginine decarboxylase-like enzyme
MQETNPPPAPSTVRSHFCTIAKGTYANPTVHSQNKRYRSPKKGPQKYESDFSYSTITSSNTSTRFEMLRYSVIFTHSCHEISHSRSRMFRLTPFSLRSVTIAIYYFSTISVHTWPTENVLYAVPEIMTALRHFLVYTCTHTHTHNVRNIITNEVQQATFIYWTITYLYSMLI